VKFKKISHILAFLVAFVMLFAVVACGSSKKSSDNQTSKQTTLKEATTSAETTEKTTSGSTKEPTEIATGDNSLVGSNPEGGITLENIPAYSGSSYVVVNNNEPFFKEDEIKTSSYEYYSDLDELGRCGITHACVGKDIMPTEDRGNIGQVKPTGWHTVKYDIVDGKYLYNRCHLIGFQLTGENANKKNLITGTRSMNVDGMLPFENMVADYVKETDNHVMYRVTPMYKGNDLVAYGVLMEAISVEDDGEGILFNVFVYNAQPGIEIDYATGESWLVGEGTTEKETTITVWITSTGSKYHSINDCGTMNPDKAQKMSQEDAEEAGYEPCEKCH